MSHRIGLVDEELTAVAIVHDSGAAEIVDALLPRGRLTATDRQVLAMSAEKADATARAVADVEPPELNTLAGQVGPVRGTRCGPAR
jgi:hypothetical protein